MKPNDLISANDWDDIRCHLLAMRERVLTRTLDGMTVTVRTEPVNSYAWNVAMVVTVRAEYKGFLTMQHFSSVEQAQHYVKDWRC